MNKWHALFNSWRRKVLSLSETYFKSWQELGLGDPGVFVARRPLSRSVVLGVNEFIGLPADAVEFYRSTDGWPMWLGPDECEIVRLSEIEYFEFKYPEQYQIAMSAFGPGLVPIIYEGEVIDLSGSIVLSKPIAREIVLSSNGRVVLFCFDHVQVYSTIFAFLQSMEERLIKALRSMLESH